MRYWILLSRIPFLGVVVLPYLLGTLLALRLSGRFSLPVFMLGLCASLFVQLASHYSGEVYDSTEDGLSAASGKNPFSGGSQVLVKGLVPRGKVRTAAYCVALAALAIGCVLQFHFKTGAWTIPLGLSGIICGIFYSKPPLRLISRGLGEAAIAYSFGLLAVNAAFYIQASGFHILPFFVSLPIACSVANIILINEYPDYEADKQASKNNLLVRLGKKKTAFLYALLAACAAGCFFAACEYGLPLATLYFYFPVMALSAALAFLMARGLYEDKALLEKMCAFTILVNLGTCLSCIAALLFGLI
jgi:1,4-dihydroxy-2-naphthoate octaprenyltransferase